MRDHTPPSRDRPDIVAASSRLAFGVAPRARVDGARPGCDRRVYGDLHPEKTGIVYCKDDDRKGEHEHVKFDFLGFTFQPRRAKNRWGKFFVSFLPAISTRAANAVRARIRGWRIPSTRNNQTLEDLARLTDPVVRGWMNYYGRFYRSKCVQVLRHLNNTLVTWARRKYKRFRRRERAAAHWLGAIAQRAPRLLALWSIGVRPAAGTGGAG